MPPTTAQTQEEAVQRALADKRIADLEAQLKELREDRDKFLKWGVIVLGGAVLSLVGIIFKLVTGHAP